MRRLIRLCCLVLLTIFALVPHAKHLSAQSTDPEWRYATSDTQLVAYTIDGEVNVLLDFDDLRLYGAVQFADNHALLQFGNVEGNYYYYHLTPQSAESVDIDPSFGGPIVMQTPHHAFLRGGAQFGGEFPNVLYDANARQFYELQGFVRFPYQANCCAFSADGRILRYASYPDAESEQWSIIERDLATGEEHIFFAPDVVFDDRFDATVGTDSHGEHWIWSNRDDENGLFTMNVVGPDGSNTVIVEIDTQNPPDVLYRFVSDYIIERPIACDDGCLMTLRPYEGDPFVLPTLDVNPRTLRRLNETQFLMTTSDQRFWLVGADSPPLFIGEMSIDMFSSERLFSPDGRWLSLVDNADAPTMLLIWDTTSQAAAFELPIAAEERFFLYGIYYSPYGQILDVLAGGQLLSVGFDYATGNAITYPTVENERHNYFEILSDGTALLQRVNLETREGMGIWRYDPATDDLSPVLVDGEWQPIQFRSIP